MSKIVPISENQAVFSQGSVQKAPNDLFKQSLEKAMESQKASEASALSPLGEVHPATFHQITAPVDNVTRQTNELLDLMDHYARDLNNPSKSLKDIAPLLEEISYNAKELMAETRKMPLTEENLREIASRAAITAEVELIKFKRGDYI